ncbi:MAG TPA: 2OG-Fe(II) oxygenase [Acidimicrobiales bacterium]
MTAGPGRAGLLDRLAAVDLAGEPFPHFVMDDLLDRVDGERIRAWLEHEAEWKLQERSFYCQDTCNNAESLRAGPLACLCNPATLEGLADHLGEMFGLDLETKSVHVEAHRLRPGQGIGIHNDNPRFGTESVRLVIHFGGPYNDSDGGHLLLFTGPDPTAMTTVVRPLHNSAAGFLLSEKSYHAVSDVKAGGRYSVVVGFFERGRTPMDIRMEFPDLLERRDELLADPAVEKLLVAAKQSGAELIEHGAANLLEHFVSVAAILIRWGCRPVVWKAGLFHSAYGTRSVEALIDRRDRSMLRNLIGDEAERLVFLYGAVRYGDAARTLEGDGYHMALRDGGSVELTRSDVIDLNLLVWANRLAQDQVLELSLDDVLLLNEVIAKLEDGLPGAALADLAPIRASALPWLDHPG